MSEIDYLVPTSGLLAWHKYEAGVSGHHIIYDYSGNSRTIQCSIGNEPVLTTNVINGRPAWYFNGSRDPLVYTGALTPKHIFVLAAYADATFPVSGGAGEYAGLLSGKDTANNAILIGDPTTTKFYDAGYGSTHEYRKRDVLLTNANMQAGMSNSFAIYEVRYPTGWALDGIQVGKDRTFANRKWKGYFVEQMMFDRILSDAEIFDVYEYFAIMFQVWKQDAAGLNVFPFNPNWARPLTTGKRVLSSVSVSGAFKGRSKGTRKIGIEPTFETRTPEEYDTAVDFWDDHHPGTSFIYRDGAFSPPRDTEMRFTSDMPQTATDTRDITYSFQAEQV